MLSSSLLYSKKNVHFIKLHLIIIKNNKIFVNLFKKRLKNIYYKIVHYSGCMLVEYFFRQRLPGHKNESTWDLVGSLFIYMCECQLTWQKIRRLEETQTFPATTNEKFVQSRFVSCCSQSALVYGLKIYK